MKRSRGPEDDLDSHSQRADAVRPAVSDAALRPKAKIAGLDCAVEDEPDSVAMKCSLPPHKDSLTFRSYDEYEAHYNKSHTNRCLECRKNFPTEHLLNIHIEECHDPLVVVRREKGEHTYSCFVEGCDRKCSTHQKRRMHMVDKHMYPKNFFFAVTRDGIDGRRSLLNDNGHHRRRSSTSAQSKETRRRASLLEAGGAQSQDAATSPTAQDSTKDDPDSDEPADSDMAHLTGAMSSLNFVPPSVRFGKGRAGFSKR
ncbi:hypothetical protein G7046_g9599 [Stylonectria norvegica]|nr:hypothetical protein G7046_g9599 [Stylonectria norvegica]